MAYRELSILLCVHPSDNFQWTDLSKTMVATPFDCFHVLCLRFIVPFFPWVFLPLLFLTDLSSRTTRVYPSIAQFDQDRLPRSKR